jgi:hypothetical protein
MGGVNSKPSNSSSTNSEYASIQITTIEQANNTPSDVTTTTTIISNQL